MGRDDFANAGSGAPANSLSGVGKHFYKGDTRITAATPLATKLKALIGRKVGVLDVGGGLQYQLEALLSSSGIDPAKVPVVGITRCSAELAALKRGAIDVIGPAVPFCQTAVAEGYGVMVANIWGGEVANLRGAPFELMSVNDTWGKVHATTVEAMQAAIGGGAGCPTSTAITKAEFGAMQSFAKLSGAKTAAVTYGEAVWGK